MFSTLNLEFRERELESFYAALRRACTNTITPEAYSRGLFWDSRSQSQAVLLHSPTNVDNTAAAAVVVVFVALSVYFKVEEKKRGTRENIICWRKAQELSRKN